MVRRRPLLEMLTAERNRLAGALKPVREDIQAHSHWLAERIKEIDLDLAPAVKASPAWREPDELWRSPARGWGRYYPSPC